MCVCVWGELINPGVLRNALGRKERKEGRGGGGGGLERKRKLQSGQKSAFLASWRGSGLDEMSGEEQCVFTLKECHSHLTPPALPHSPCTLTSLPIGLDARLKSVPPGSF